MDQDGSKSPYQGVKRGYAKVSHKCEEENRGGIEWIYGARIANPMGLTAALILRSTGVGF
jgi:hypothetical protein